MVINRVSSPSFVAEPHFTTHASSTLLFADISGYTALAQSLGAAGAEGTEALSSALDNFFGIAISSIYRFGGDVIKFCGDAILCVFQPDRYVSYRGGGASETSAKIIQQAVRCRCCCRCCCRCSSAAEAGEREGCRGETPRTPPGPATSHWCRRGWVGPLLPLLVLAEAGCFARGLSGGDPPPVKLYARAPLTRVRWGWAAARLRR
jgi:hypothetical protein